MTDSISWLPFLLGIPFIVVGLYLFWTEWQPLQLGRNSRNWHQSQAQITRAWVAPVVSNNIEQDIIWRHDLCYRPYIEYRFQVKQREFTGSQLCFGEDPTANRHFAMYAEKQLANMRAGTTTSIYFNPNDPDQSVIFRGISKYSIQKLVAALFSIVLGCSFIVFLNTTFFQDDQIFSFLGSIAIYVPILLVLIAPLIWLSAGKANHEARVFSEGPTTQGKVFWQKMLKKSGNTKRHRDGQSTSQTLYNAELAYTYAVDGVQYTGNRYNTLYTSSSNKNKAEQLLKKYPVDTPVTVHYNSTSPWESVLIPSSGAGGIILRFVAIFFFILGVALTYMTIFY